MSIFNKGQRSIAKKIKKGTNISNWKDWRWQLKHSIRSIEKFEFLTGIKFSEEEREDLEKTFSKFPLSITPYYLSLIDTDNYRYDPVFKQSFGSIDEMSIHDSEFKDPLAEDKDSPVEGLTHRYPDRITDNLIKILKKHQPLWINTHFNHPREITSSSKEALTMLADGGFPLGNQSVLLADINDCPRIMKSLVHKLVQHRVRPYYLYQCDLSEGLSHFRTPIGKGIEIMESLIGHTTGFAVPTYVIDAPGGGGKISVMPNYIISWLTNKVVLRNYEGIITTYREPESYEAKFYDRNCDECNLDLQLDDADEYASLGIEKLLSDQDNTISLIPGDNLRYKKRE